MSLYYIGGDIHGNKVFEKGLVAPSKAGQVLSEPRALRRRIHDMRNLSSVNKASLCFCLRPLNTYRILQQALGTAICIVHQIVNMSRAVLRHIVANRRSIAARSILLVRVYRRCVTRRIAAMRRRRWWRGCCRHGRRQRRLS